MLQNNSYYGGYDTSTFSEVYPSFDEWEADNEVFKDSLNFYGQLTEDTLKQIYYILASEYAFSHHIGSRDQWKLMLWARVMEYGPYLKKELEVQREVLATDIENLREGGKAIYNTALNPGTRPTTGSLQELDYINQQNTTNYKKSKPEAYAILVELMNKNLIKDFVRKFKDLFITVCYPDYPLYYINNPELTMLEGDN